MELIFATIIGVGIGTVLRYLIPGRETYGILLLPAIGGIVTAVVWVGLVWLGWGFDGGWIWVVSLGAAGVVCILVAVLLPRLRRQSDAARFTELSRPGAVGRA